MSFPNRVQVDVDAKTKAVRIETTVDRKDLSFGVNIGRALYPADVYEGGYEVTPTQNTQVLETQNKTLLENVVVNPIPSNYGLITWNGATLKVS